MGALITNQLLLLLLMVFAFCIVAAKPNDKKKPSSLLLIEKTLEYKEYKPTNMTVWTSTLTDSKGVFFAWMNGVCQQTRVQPHLELCTANIFSMKWTVSLQGTYSDEEDGYDNNWVITGGNTKQTKLNKFTYMSDESKGNGTFYLTFR